MIEVGVGRAGWYSYDLLDNLGRPSARRYIPEWQNLAPGDVLPMSPDGKRGIEVYSLDHPHSMIWGTRGDTTWVWQLDAQTDGITRLLTRIRSRIRWTPMSIAFSTGGRRFLDDPQDADQLARAGRERGNAITKESPSAPERETSTSKQHGSTVASATGSITNSRT